MWGERMRFSSPLRPVFFDSGNNPWLVASPGPILLTRALVLDAGFSERIEKSGAFSATIAVIQAFRRPVSFLFLGESFQSQQPHTLASSHQNV